MIQNFPLIKKDDPDFGVAYVNLSFLNGFRFMHAPVELFEDSTIVAKAVRLDCSKTDNPVINDVESALIEFCKGHEDSYIIYEAFYWLLPHDPYRVAVTIRFADISQFIA